MERGRRLVLVLDDDVKGVLWEGRIVSRIMSLKIHRSSINMTYEFEFSLEKLSIEINLVMK